MQCVRAYATQLLGYCFCQSLSLVNGVVYFLACDFFYGNPLNVEVVECVYDFVTYFGSYLSFFPCSFFPFLASMFEFYLFVVNFEVLEEAPPSIKGN